MYAVIKTGGKQYQVSPGTKIVVEKIEGDKGSNVELKDILLLVDESLDAPVVGKPVIDGAVVNAKIITTAKSKKVIVFKYKRRKGYMRKKGHRQELTMLEILSIEYNGKKWAIDNAKEKTNAVSKASSKATSSSKKVSAKTETKKTVSQKVDTEKSDKSEQIADKQVKVTKED